MYEFSLKQRSQNVTTTSCHAADLHSLERLRGRKVDIEADTFGQALCQHFADDLLDIRTQGLQVGVFVVIAAGEGHGRNSFETSLFGDTHGAAVMIIDRRVVTMVDAAEYEVGHALLAELVDSDLHAVNGCASAGPYGGVSHIVTRFES